ncbi:M15 family metallopeptidase [Halobacillus sp. H74]|uniref:M15 family metallopeptidase n=1 Tax=Halobacillus sp. H74 TaxID=3457436 RepID=UPI003FCC4A51
MKKALLLTLLSLLLAACSPGSFSAEEPEEEVPASSTVDDEEVKEKESTEADQETGTEEQTGEEGANEQKEEKVTEDGLIQVDKPESMTVVVNKNRKLPGEYVPPDLTVPDVPFYFNEDHPKKQMREEAARALEELFAAAEKDGLDLVAASGYRSYDRQKEIYERNVEIYGEEETNTFSAKPGTSEHQTGLAMDVTSAEMSFKLEQSFGNTSEGEWLAEHAHEHGFIIRYIKGMKEVTGYMYEPWHLRYVGEEYSTDVHEREVTLEEFFGYYPSDE